MSKDSCCFFSFLRRPWTRTTGISLFVEFDLTLFIVYYISLYIYRRDLQITFQINSPFVDPRAEGPGQEIFFFVVKNV